MEEEEADEEEAVHRKSWCLRRAWDKDEEGEEAVPWRSWCLPRALLVRGESKWD